MSKSRALLLILLALLLGGALVAGADSHRARDRVLVSLAGAALGTLVAMAVSRAFKAPVSRQTIASGVFVGAWAAAPYEILTAGQAGAATGYGLANGAMLALLAMLLFAGVRALPARDKAAASSLAGRELFTVLLFFGAIAGGLWYAPRTAPSGYWEGQLKNGSGTVLELTIAGAPDKLEGTGGLRSTSGVLMLRAAGQAAGSHMALVLDAPDAGVKLLLSGEIRRGRLEGSISSDSIPPIPVTLERR